MYIADNGLAARLNSDVLALKQPGAVEAVRDLCRGADGLIEGFRPGMMEWLGFCPEVMLADNP